MLFVIRCVDRCVFLLHDAINGKCIRYFGQRINELANDFVAKIFRIDVSAVLNYACLSLRALVATVACCAKKNRKGWDGCKTFCTLIFAPLCNFLGTSLGIIPRWLYRISRDAISHSRRIECKQTFSNDR